MKVWLGWAPLTPSGQQLQRGVVARGQGDGLPGGADDVIGSGGAEVEGGAAGGQAGPDQGGREGKAVAVEPASAELRSVCHDPRPVEGGGKSIDLLRGRGDNRGREHLDVGCRWAG